MEVDVGDLGAFDLLRRGSVEPRTLGADILLVQSRESLPLACLLRMIANSGVNKSTRDLIVQEARVCRQNVRNEKRQVTSSDP